MTKKDEKADPFDKTDPFFKTEEHDEDLVRSATVEMCMGSLAGEIPSKHRAYMEIIRLEDTNEVIDLGEEAMLIGRSPKCEIQLRVKNVSRRHARVFFRNEEYHIEDLGSINGTYVNGIRVERCILRNHDQVEIGGVRVLFKEEKTLQTK